MTTKKRAGAAAAPAAPTVRGGGRAARGDPKVRQIQRGPFGPPVDLVSDVRKAAEEMERRGLAFPPGARDFIENGGSSNAPYARMAGPDAVRGFVGPISDDWSGPRGRRGGRRPSPPESDGARIEIALAEERDGGARHGFRVGASTTLKALFNEYADQRGVSLRSLRFSHGGKTLFLSNAGRKTPEELGLRDKDVIAVHDAASSKDDDATNQRPEPSKKAKAKKKSCNRKPKGKRRSKQRPQPAASPKTMEEHKVEHSKRLTQIHAEAQDEFQQIRRRLNNLVIERSRPKDRSKRPRSRGGATPALPAAVANPIEDGLGGKAGRSRYEIRVGEARNLHRTTGPSRASPRASPRASNDPSLVLDLHGCARGEALARLDDALERWIDVAMTGAHPFVASATVVCGCGDQVLSEVVRGWIREEGRVAHAPGAGGGRGSRR